MRIELQHDSADTRCNHYTTKTMLLLVKILYLTQDKEKKEIDCYEMKRFEKMLSDPVLKCLSSKYLTTKLLTCCSTYSI